MRHYSYAKQHFQLENHYDHHPKKNIPLMDDDKNGYNMVLQS